MQLHHWDAHGHPHLGKQTLAHGNGAVLWFLTSDIDEAYQRAQKAKAHILEPLKLNTNANHREFWIKDIDDYVVVVAGQYGDI